MRWRKLLTGLSISAVSIVVMLLILEAIVRIFMKVEPPLRVRDGEPRQLAGREHRERHRANRQGHPPAAEPARWVLPCHLRKRRTKSTTMPTECTS